MYLSKIFKHLCLINIIPICFFYSVTLLFFILNKDRFNEQRQFLQNKTGSSLHADMVGLTLEKIERNILVVNDLEDRIGVKENTKHRILERVNTFLYLIFIE